MQQIDDALHVGTHHRLVSILDGDAACARAELFPDVPDLAWAAEPESLDSKGDVPLALGGILLHTGDRVALIDLGVGPELATHFKFLDRLRAAGVAPDEVTDVLFTHLHFDHVGWSTLDGELTFPNATYRCGRDDWTYFVEEERDHPTERLSRPLLEGVEQRLEPWDGDVTLWPGVDVVAAAGHTPGSSVIVLSTPDERAVLLGDVVHCPAQLLHPDWSALGDVNPRQAEATRERLARELDDPSTHVAGAHFPGLQFGRVVTGSSGRRQWAYAI
jgi:glyoxylase-like metal-dependent hydrolase (beta-lactamase superfamily II)